MAGWRDGGGHCIRRPIPTAILSCLSFWITVTYSLGWASRTSCCEDEATHLVGLELDTPRHRLLPLVTGLLCHTLCSLRGLLVHPLSLLCSELCRGSHLAQSISQEPDRAWNVRFPDVPHSACSSEFLAIPECTSHDPL